MTRKDIENYCLERDLTLTVADGLDDALLGVTTDVSPARAVYSRDKCIEILAQDMTYEQAVEYFEFNVAGAYVGEQTPLFIDVIMPSPPARPASKRRRVNTKKS